jgi:hypothetical protein
LIASTTPKAIAADPTSNDACAVQLRRGDGGSQERVIRLARLKGVAERASDRGSGGWGSERGIVSIGSGCPQAVSRRLPRAA